VQVGSSQKAYAPTPQSPHSRRWQKSHAFHGSNARVGGRPSLAKSGSSSRPCSAHARHAVSLQSEPEHVHANASTCPHAAAGSELAMCTAGKLRRARQWSKRWLHAARRPVVARARCDVEHCKRDCDLFAVTRAARRGVRMGKQGGQ
jgi:hypothetical protein